MSGTSKFDLNSTEEPLGVDENEIAEVSVSQYSATPTNDIPIKGNVQDSRVSADVEEKLEMGSNGLNPCTLEANQNVGILGFDVETKFEASDGDGYHKHDENQMIDESSVGRSGKGSFSGVTFDEPKVASLVVDMNFENRTGGIAADEGIGRKAEDGDYADANQSKGSYSQVTFNESNRDSLVVDLNSTFRTVGTEDKVNDEIGHCVEEELVETEKQIVGFEQPNESEFASSDLVWGKVKSHPWWPGQIFDPSHASEKAVKHFRKKGTYLVAYFGDQSFAWNDPLSLKPFKANYSEMVKQTSTASFQDAVNCALDEVSRRVVLGLSCSCTPEDIYATRESQWIVNSGIRENVCLRDGMDKFFSVASFEPEKLVQSMKELALTPFYEGDSMEFALVKGQLVAFYGSKGYFQLPEFYVSDGLSGVVDQELPVYEKEEKARSGKGKLRSQEGTPIKRQGDLEDSFKSKKKERSLTELMKQKNSSCDVNGAENGVSEEDGSKSELPSVRKRKTTESSSSERTGTRKRNRLGPLKSCSAESPSSKASKVGERFCSIAKQLTGSPPVLKCDSERFLETDVKEDSRKKTLDEVNVTGRIARRKPGRPRSVQKGGSPDEMLSQLCLTARDPMKGYSFLTTIVGFFTGFRNSISEGGSSSIKRKKSEKKLISGDSCVRNRKASNSQAIITESYDYGAVTDSYWTDRIIQNNPEDQVSHKKQKKTKESPMEFTLKDGTTFESNDSYGLNLISECNKDTSTIEPVNFSQLNPIVDSNQQGLDGSSILDSKQQGLNDNSNLIAENSVGGEKNLGELSPTALTLNFTDAKSIPLESDLKRIFSGFGTLRESETEILRKTKRARVVFERRSDADEAFRRACKYSVFGPALVSYKLTSWPCTPSKASPCPKRQIREGASPSSTEGNRN